MTARRRPRVEADVFLAPRHAHRIALDDQVIHRGLRVDLERSDGGKVATIASPLRLTGTPPQYRRAPPLLGEHTDEILKSILGKNEADIAHLKTSGIV